jgi:hypothetical protein
MLEHLLAEIRRGGTLETSVLAARLGTSPQMVAAMLYHLQRLGSIQPYIICGDGCAGCCLRDGCQLTHDIRLWQTATSV